MNGHWILVFNLGGLLPFLHFLLEHHMFFLEPLKPLLLGSLVGLLMVRHYRLVVLVIVEIELLEI
jgi:hypothetical protein